VITVLLVDDSELMRKALIQLLNSDPEIQVLGEAVSLNEAIRLTGKLSPHVVLLDLHLGDENSITPSKAKSAFSGSRVVAMSFANDTQTQRIADAYGAVALLDKTTLANELIPALKQCRSLPRLLFRSQTGKLQQPKSKGPTG
jgi:DNA-binding NarL/FixJ family response regulator